MQKQTVKKRRFGVIMQTALSIPIWKYSKNPLTLLNVRQKIEMIVKFSKMIRHSE